MATLCAMPAPHPVAMRVALGGDDEKRALAYLRALLLEHGGDVRAVAAALEPTVHEVTLHGWLTRWGLRGAVDKGRAKKR